MICKYMRWKFQNVKICRIDKCLDYMTNAQLLGDLWTNQRRENIVALRSSSALLNKSPCTTYDFAAFGPINSTTWSCDQINGLEFEGTLFDRRTAGKIMKRWNSITHHVEYGKLELNLELSISLSDDRLMKLHRHLSQ